MSEQIEAAPTTARDHSSPDFRYATTADLNAIVRLENEAFSQDRISRRSFARLLRSRSAKVLVAVFGGTIEGCAVVLFRSYSRRCRLYSLAVSKAAQGKGLGGRLLAQAEQAAQERGCDAVSLEVREKNVAAVKLYERNGYELLGETLGYYSDGAAALHFMKPLTQATSR